jgi:hypothetical protein
LTCSHNVPSKIAHCAIIPELFMANDALRMKVQLCKISPESERSPKKSAPLLYKMTLKFDENYILNSILIVEKTSFKIKPKTKLLDSNSPWISFDIY